MVLQYVLLATILLLAIFIVAEDFRKLEIAAIPVLMLSLLMIAHGYLFPLSGLAPHHALAGAAVGLAMGTMARGYTHLRTGVAAFGGADIALIAGAGGLVGPFLFGPWLFLAALSGAALILASPIFLRRHDIDGKTLDVAPFCPALILSAGLIFALAEAGVLAGNIFA